jgi:enamine deaminase RidA (YjgF/YER057c/UK114 family)
VNDLMQLYGQPADGGDSGRRMTFDPDDPGLQHINPEGLFDGRRLFSQMIVAPRGRTLWIAGLIGCDRDNRLVSTEKTGQIAQAFANLAVALAAAGCPARQVVRITEYVADYSQGDLPAISAGIDSLFPPGQRPINVLVPVPRLGRDGAWFEIDAVAVVPA